MTSVARGLKVNMWVPWIMWLVSDLQLPLMALLLSVCNRLRMHVSVWELRIVINELLLKYWNCYVWNKQVYSHNLKPFPRLLVNFDLSLIG